jgi:two-component SAPR family response regulator
VTDDQHSSSQKRPRTKRVLIIESDFLIAEMIQNMVEDLGYIVSRTVHHLPSALEELKKENFDSVLVNIGIDQEKHGTDIADILTDMGVPFAFVTGYPHSLSGRHPNVPLLQKPFSKNQLRELLEKLVGPSGAPQTNR